MMRTLLAVCLAGAMALASAGSARAIAIPSTTNRACGDRILYETRWYVYNIQGQIRYSIRNNSNARDSRCSGGFACAGGANHGLLCNPASGHCSVSVATACVQDADCPMGEDCVADNADCPGAQCAVRSNKGIAGTINRYKDRLRYRMLWYCPSAANFSALGYPNARCPDGVDADSVADCILRGVMGDTATAEFGDPLGEIFGRGVHQIVPDSPLAPEEVCGLSLGSLLSIGSENAAPTIGEAGDAQPLTIDSCTAGVCETSGQGVVGNDLSAPVQTYAGIIPVCLVTVSGDAGNGTSEDGQIDLNTGQQSSFVPTSTRVLIGTTCPICSSGIYVCDSGARMSQPCTSGGHTDIACPPSIVGPSPVISNPLTLDTESHALSVPPHSPGTGVTNPNGTFCGACDNDETIGCANDADCVARGACSGAVGSGCCAFGGNTGAFGIDTATTASANGVRGPYLPRLATIFCNGKTDEGLVDSFLGLPGPVRYVVQQLNAFQYPTPPTP